jgi:hypothetical protein
MARPLGIECAGAFDHLPNRGQVLRRGAVRHAAQDRQHAREVGRLRHPLQRIVNNEDATPIPLPTLAVPQQVAGIAVAQLCQVAQDRAIALTILQGPRFSNHLQTIKLAHARPFFHAQIRERSLFFS